MDLKKAINEYKKNLDLLNAEKSASIDDLINVLISRDLVQDYLRKESHSIDSQSLSKIKDTDSDLKDAIKKHKKLINENYENLICLREIKLVSSESWWWSFKQPVHILDILDPILNLFTLFCLGFSFALSIEMISRLIGGEGDFILSIFAAIQASLTLWIGKTFLTDSPGEALGKIINRVFKWAKINRHYHAELSFLMALIIAVITFFSHTFFMPLFSTYHINKGNDARRENNIAKSFSRYQKAVNIDPNNIEAIHYLGELYDELSISNKAKEVYEKAMLEDYIAAYNNLSRLLIKEGKYSDAFQLASKALKIAPEKRKEEPTRYPETKYLEDRYASFKNLGWARFMLGNNQEAIDYFKLAIAEGKKLNHKNAAANCLLAEALEVELNNSENSENQANISINEIITEWRRCEDNANPKRADEVEWLRKAKKRIKYLRLKKKEN